jgi:hypothetical protein
MGAQLLLLLLPLVLECAFGLWQPLDSKWMAQGWAVPRSTARCPPSLTAAAVALGGGVPGRR